MQASLVQKEEEFIKIYREYVDMVYRICFLYFKNKADTEDAVQNVFLKFMTKNPTFETEQKRKAWLIVTASNECKNHVKHWWQKKVAFEEFEVAVKDKKDETLETLLCLPNKYKTILYCYYYEGYKTGEIASMLQMNEATVRSNLLRGRNYLRELLEGEKDEECKNNSGIKQG